MKKALPLLLLLLTPALAFAQELKPLMTLADCVAFAQAHSPQLQQVESRLGTLEVAHSAAQQAFMPGVSASVGEQVSFGRSQGKDAVYRDLSSANTSFQIGAEVSIFEGGRKWYQLKKSKAELETAGYIVAEALDNIALRVTSSYITLLLSEEIARIAEENLQLSSALLEQVRTQVEAGKLPPSRAIEMESQVGRDQLSVAETRADVERAKKALLLDMGVRQMPTSVAFKSTAPEVVVQRLSMDHSSALASNEWVLPATQQLMHQVERAQYDISIARASFFPSLSLSAGYSNGYYYLFGPDFQGTNIPFQDQLRDNGRTFVGVTLNIPIYARGQRQAQLQQARLQEQALRSQLEQRKVEDLRNITLAEADLRKAEEQHRVSARNVELSTKALEMADAEYQAGRMSTYDWEQAKNRKAQAEAAQVQAIYTRLLRTINLAYFRSGNIPLHLAD